MLTLSLQWLAMGVDLVHAASMLVWGLGLPLLFWHRYPRLSRLYVGYALVFLAVSVGSHALLGECVLTTLSRALWQAGGGHRDEVPFVVTLVNAVARVRPSTRAAVLVWELAIAVSALGVWWHFRQLGRRPRGGMPAASRRGAEEC